MIGENEQASSGRLKIVTRYFFDFWEAGELLPDEEGSELSDLSQAQGLAADTLGSIISDMTGDEGCALQCSISVRDGTVVVFRVTASELRARAGQDDRST